MKKVTRNVRLDGPERGGMGGRVERWFLFNHRFNACVAGTAKLGLSLLIWPRFVAPYRWALTRHALPLGNLDPAFEGYKILQLTDLHVWKTREAYLAQVFARCLEEKPDLIVLTGDLIDYHPKALPILRRLLEPLVAARAPDGVAAIFGNHDYHEYSWRHVGARSARRAVHKRLVELVQGLGIRLLRNEQMRVRRPKATGAGVAELVVVGLDEMWTGRADAAAAFAGLTAGQPILCLQHNPDGIEFLKEYPWQFMLCGHSHGGQAVLPLIGALYVPMEHRKYLRGFFDFPALEGQGVARRTMFVSRGLGHSTPIRMHCRPEATVFRLTAVS